MTNALHRRFAARLIGIIIPLGILSGCTTFCPEPKEPVQRQTVLSARYIDARSIYDQGLYEKALERFIILTETEVTEETLNNARFGEICCRLILANTPAQYDAALDLWDDLTRLTSAQRAVLEYDLLDPVIVHLTYQQVLQNVNADPPTDSQQQTNGRTDKPKMDTKAAQKKIHTLETQIKKSDELQQQLKALEEENKSLKEKIKALEAIDQTIEKKKTEISSPGE